MRRILIVNCSRPYEHRVELLRQYFLGQGSEVKVITSDWLHMEKTVRADCPEGYELLHTRPYYRNLSVRRILSHIDFAKAAYRKMEEYSPDFLWVMLPPNSLAKAAVRYKRKNPHVKLVLDIMDMWPESLPVSKIKSLPPFAVWRNLRDRCLEAADVLVTECDLYQTVLRKATRKPMNTLYLARERTLPEARPDPPADRICLCYLGSVNNVIDIPRIGQIIRDMELPVELHIIGDGEKRQELIDTASQAGANVIYHGMIYDPVQKQDVFNRCHFGLNVMKETVFVGLTMKSMDFFEAELPIINTIGGDTWRMVEEYGAGINYTGQESLSMQKLTMAQQKRPEMRSFFEAFFTAEVFCGNVREILDRMWKESVGLRKE